MSRYIDIEPYEKDGWYLQKRYHNSNCEVIKTTPLILIPTAEAEPIKHGHWIEREEWFEFEPKPRKTVGCSECGHSMYSKHDTLNYCPNCGARMDEVEE